MLFCSLFRELFRNAAGLPHPLNQTRHLDDRFQADRWHHAALTEVASKIFRRGVSIPSRVHTRYEIDSASHSSTCDPTCVDQASVFDLDCQGGRSKGGQARGQGSRIAPRGIGGN